MKKLTIPLAILYGFSLLTLAVIVTNFQSNSVLKNANANSHEVKVIEIRLAQINATLTDIDLTLNKINLSIVNVKNWNYYESSVMKNILKIVIMIFLH